MLKASAYRYVLMCLAASMLAQKKKKSLMSNDKNLSNKDLAYYQEKGNITMEI